MESPQVVHKKTPTHKRWLTKVHWTLGILRHFQVFFCSQAGSQPPVMPAVGRNLLNGTRILNDIRVLFGGLELSEAIQGLTEQLLSIAPNPFPLTHKSGRHSASAILQFHSGTR